MHENFRRQQHMTRSPLSRHWRSLFNLAGLAAGLWLLVATTTVIAAPLAGSQAAPTLQGISYIPVDDENSVYAIDNAAHQVIKKIPVGVHPIVLKALPDHSKVYVDNFGPLPATITVIDTASNKVVKSIDMDATPWASMELSPDGRYLYVPLVNSKVQVIDTKTDTIARTFPVLPFPMALQVSPDGNTFYAFTAEGLAAAYDAHTGAQTDPPLLVSGLAPAWSAISPDGSKLYAINFITSNITVINTKTWAITATIQLNLTSLPLSGTITPDGSQMYICNVGSYNITVIDLKTQKIIKVIPTKDAPAFVGFSPDGKYAYLSDLGPISALPPTARWLLYDFFYLLPPGIPGHIVTYDTSTYNVVGPPTITGTGPVAGVYF